LPERVSEIKNGTGHEDRIQNRYNLSVPGKDNRALLEGEPANPVYPAYREAGGRLVRRTGEEFIYYS